MTHNAVCYIKRHILPHSHLDTCFVLWSFFRKFIYAIVIIVCKYIQFWVFYCTKSMCFVDLLRLNFMFVIIIIIRFSIMTFFFAMFNQKVICLISGSHSQTQSKPDHTNHVGCAGSLNMLHTHTRTLTHSWILL